MPDHRRWPSGRLAVESYSTYTHVCIIDNSHIYRICPAMSSCICACGTRPSRQAARKTPAAKQLQTDIMRDVPVDVDLAANMYTGSRIRTNNMRKMNAAVASTNGSDKPVSIRYSWRLTSAATTLFHGVAESRHSIWKLIIHIRSSVRARGADVLTYWPVSGPAVTAWNACARLCTRRAYVCAHTLRRSSVPLHLLVRSYLVCALF